MGKSRKCGIYDKNILKVREKTVFRNKNIIGKIIIK